MSEGRLNSEEGEDKVIVHQAPPKEEVKSFWTKRKIIFSLAFGIFFCIAIAVGIFFIVEATKPADAKFKKNEVRKY